MDLVETIEDNFVKLFEEKPKKSANLPEDPIALACASYRLWESTKQKFADLRTVTCSDEDRAKAQQVRRYYGDRILMSMLKQDGRTTEFRKKVYGIINNTYDVKEDDLGILYRLPYFYHEDLKLDSVIEQTQQVPDMYRGNEIEATFSVISEIYIGRRSGELTHFWLGSDLDRAAYKIAIRNDNSLFPLLKSILQRPVRLQANAYTKRHLGTHSDRCYNMLGNVRLVLA